MLHEIDRVTPEIDRLLDEAFGIDRRSRTAYRLRERTSPIAHLSHAARDADGLVAALLCWPIALQTRTGRRPLTLLGPVAVARRMRNHGIGSRLMRECLDRADGHPMALVGDASYYGRFGFTAEATGQWTMPGPFEPHRLLARNARDLAVAGALIAA